MVEAVGRLGPVSVHGDKFFKMQVGKEHTRRLLAMGYGQDIPPIGGSVNMPGSRLLPPLDNRRGGNQNAGAAQQWAAARARSGRHGRMATDVTSKQNCAYVKWHQHDSSDESPVRYQRRLEFSEIPDKKASGSTHVANVLLGGGHSEYSSWQTTNMEAYSSPMSARF
eukprot:gnl/MRDRNA2_/MRDRNA2_120402_c0_seq1.p1 gnl/MRDRNA2_/MRDRNA2_120402_c0~~gnl/MRDRNA2_/MRDRNA2_120402_c0_seq1.p1  ORF type:complete len:167 (-),score=24.49 gnl/MRDRNA2_/MRDRNA2_120402_c0_seq1:6-506(-)